MRFFRPFSVILVLTAVCVGFLHVLPHSFMNLYQDADQVYYPFSFAELLYAAQVKEVLEGHLTVGDPQFWETKNTFPQVFPYIPVLVLAGLSYITGSVSSGFLAADFIFPALLLRKKLA